MRPNKDGYTVLEWNAKEHIPPYCLSLLLIDERIRVYNMITDNIFGDDMYYVPTKEHLYIPIGFPAVEHEVGHMVEMNSLDRCLLPDWGMQVKGFVGGKVKVPRPAAYFRALARECRVRAIQHVMDPNSLAIFPRDHIFWGHESDKYLHFGRFKSPRDVHEWGQDLFDKTYAAWNLDRIRHEWQARLNHIQNWMETNDTSRNLRHSSQSSAQAGA